MKKKNQQSDCNTKVFLGLPALSVKALLQLSGVAITIHNFIVGLKIINISSPAHKTFDLTS